jgi:hypothetical protein
MTRSFGGDDAPAWRIGWWRPSGVLRWSWGWRALGAALLLMNMVGMAGAQAKPDGTMIWGPWASGSG